MVIVENYTHSAELKTLTLQNYEVVKKERIARIYNATTENMVFDTATATGGITITNNVINYEWSGEAVFSDSDRFAIVLYESDRTAEDMVQEIAITGFYKGKPAGIYQILGRRTQFVNTTALQDVSDAITVASFLPLTSSESLQIRSSSADDTALGTGARTVRIIYIDQNNDLAVTVVSLNGTTNVVVPIQANEIILMENVTVGSTGVSQGTISLRKVTGDAIVEIIASNGNRSRSARFMIPRGYTGYLVHVDYSGIGQSMDFELRAQVSSWDRSFNEAFLFQENSFLASNTNTQGTEQDLLKFPPLCKIKVSVVPGNTATARADCTFSIAIIKN